MSDSHQFISEVQLRLRERVRHRYKRPRRAGILVPFILDAQPPRLLLTRRAEGLSSHRGEVAFPGGMKDCTDQSIIETALREAEEEIGLARERVRIVGQIDDLISKNEQVMVTPSIGVITEPPRQWTPNPDEVARVFEIPLAELYDVNRWHTERREWRGRSFQLFRFKYDGEELWGLSAYATLLALDLTAQGSPVDLSEYYHQVERTSSLQR